MDQNYDKDERDNEGLCHKICWRSSLPDAVPLGVDARATSSNSRWSCLNDWCDRRNGSRRWIRSSCEVGKAYRNHNSVKVSALSPRTSLTIIAHRLLRRLCFASKEVLEDFRHFGVELQERKLNNRDAVRTPQWIHQKLSRRNCGMLSSGGWQKQRHEGQG